MPLPADADVFTTLAAACEHVAAGRCPEIELEWWGDDSDEDLHVGSERRLTITVRSLAASQARWREVRSSAEGVMVPPPAVPDDLRELDDDGR